jgi:peptidoglycan/xylan/chitin deacetylase (PgdA/CDA1 family)
MAARLKIVHIPKTPAKAYDHHREISDLVRNQLRHAHQELQNWWGKVGGKDPGQLRTEQEAADYIRTVTRILHPEGTPRARSTASPAPKSGVWLIDPMDAPRSRPARKRKQTRKRTRTRT